MLRQISSPGFDFEEELVRSYAESAYDRGYDAAGQVTVADGTDLAAEKIQRVLTNDPGMGVIRHVDAGYDIAERTAAEQGGRIPMREF